MEAVVEERRPADLVGLRDELRPNLTDALRGRLFREFQAQPPGVAGSASEARVLDRVLEGGHGTANGSGDFDLSPGGPSTLRG